MVGDMVAHRLLAFAMASWLAGCATPPPVAPAADPGTAVCDAGDLAGFVGQPVTGALTDEARRRSGSRSLRVIKPGMPVTMDYRQDRLNVHVDDLGVVTQLTCG